ncbi:MAG: hypothetical protein JWL73_1462 [Actinomycetia bacterium]|nr:hypothetical protein [Actinomycetes bacterium]
MRAFFAFWYDFIVGDDWFVAVGIIAAIVVTWVLADAGVTAWPVILIAVPAVLLASVLRRPR